MRKQNETNINDGIKIINDQDEKQLLLTRIAKMYYVYDQSQSDIAKQEGFSRSYISKLLTEAKRQGIVKIEIVSQSIAETADEKVLREYFHLDKVYIVPNKSGVKPIVLVGAETAKILDSNLRSGDVIGVTWGETLYNVAKQLPLRKDLKNVKTIQLCGGQSNINVNTYINEVTREFSKRIGSMGHVLPFPAIVRNKELKDLITQENGYIEIEHLAKKMRIAIITVGAWNKQNSIAGEDCLTSEEVKKITKDGGVADICTHVININGDLCNEKLDARTVAIPLSYLKNAELRILAACGSSKADAIVASLNSGIANCLVTDEMTVGQIKTLYPYIFD